MRRREFLGAVGASAFAASAKIAGSRPLESIEQSLTYLTGPTKNERPPLDPTEPLLQVD